MKTLNTLNKTLIALVTGAVLTTTASAAVNYGGNMGLGQAYVGIKAGQMDTDFNDKDVDVDDTMTYGLYGGVNLGQGFGVEAEYMTSNESDIKIGGVKGDYEVDTYGAYGTYKYNFPNTGLYAKGKLGFAKVDAKVSNNAASNEKDETGVAGGLGLGFNLSNNIAIEGEYSILPDIDDVENRALTLGAHLKF